LLQELFGIEFVARVSICAEVSHDLSAVRVISLLDVQLPRRWLVLYQVWILYFSLVTDDCPELRDVNWSLVKFYVRSKLTIKLRSWLL
jgi:hypothetical protein